MPICGTVAFDFHSRERSGLKSLARPYKLLHEIPVAPEKNNGFQVSYSVVAKNAYSLSLFDILMGLKSLTMAPHNF